ncbi:glycogen synthase GlgA [bacterium]|nr:glycogen synthase GlgA [bacterium]
MLASECTPFIKTGGLADVVGALPAVLQRLGHDVVVILPAYSLNTYPDGKLTPFFSKMGVKMGGKEEWCSVHYADNAEGVRHYFIEFNQYFQREGIYNNSSMKEFDDNAERFSFFTKAALQLLKDMKFSPDVVHAHDWQTALAPAYVTEMRKADKCCFSNTKTILTIHNVGYQGLFSAQSYSYIGLPWSAFTSDILEDYGKINFLKGGIYFADKVTTVSPTYAAQIRHDSHLSFGMDSFLRAKKDNFVGILNGVDYTLWDPRTDKKIPAHYWKGKWKGKAVCKKELQRRFRLSDDAAVPIVGIVSRFAEQKGLDILASTIEAVLNTMHIQIAILGSGDSRLEHYYGTLPQKFHGRFGSFIGYDDDLAHLVEAGSDFFLMPSRYEPCGLNQLYSLRYGTLPIVRATGGLDDTIEQYTEKNGKGTGFKFDDLTPNALYDTIGWAVSTWYDRKKHITSMKNRAIGQDFSWEASAREYEELYRS